MAKWTGVDGEIGRYVRKESQRTLDAYAAQPNLVDEQANQEQDTARGGYANRQLVELVQNSADQLAKFGGGRVYIRLTDAHLYCADDGEPLDEEGARALLFSHLSPKRSTTEIGRFGVGFKSVLRVTDKPAVFSRSGSIQFDRRRAKQRIAEVAPDAKDYPVLRLAEPVDAEAVARLDPKLAELMGWARNVVRLPLKRGALESLAEQIRTFAPEFLLFVPHVRGLDLAVDGGQSRSIRRISAGGQIQLQDGDHRSRWKLFSRDHELSEKAKENNPAFDDVDVVRLQWAAPLEAARTAVQQFWAFFPTQTSSLVAGILNAPWNTNQDRQSLLPGVYNNELIEAAAQLVADSLPDLWTAEAPARHLDVLPRRVETGDNQQANLLRDRLYELLKGASIIPDQTGALRVLDDIWLAPTELTPGQRVESEPLDRWASYEHRPTDWLHHDALTSDRLAKIRRIPFRDFGTQLRGISLTAGTNSQHDPLRASISKWLTALTEAGVRVNDAVQASMAAIQTAALIPERARGTNDFGRIVLTATGAWASLDPDSVYLGGDDPSVSVHPELEADPETLAALQAFGIRAPSAEIRLRSLAAALSVVRNDSYKDQRWRKFWRYARDCGADVALRVVDEAFTSRADVRVQVENDTWRPIFDVLLPGAIVFAGGKTSHVVVGMDFHDSDHDLFSRLGVVSEPYGDAPLSGKFYRVYLNASRRWFRDHVDGQPQLPYLDFVEQTSSGPLDVFEHLPDDAKARFTEALLSLDATYKHLTMRHTTQDKYEPLAIPAPATYAIRQHGTVVIGSETYPLAAGLGEEPDSPGVQRWLLEHPRTSDIRRVFADLRSDYVGEFEAIGEDEPVPLVDAWPGLNTELRSDQQSIDLIRCDRLLDPTGSDLPFDCALRDNDLFIRRQDDEQAELKLIVQHLDLQIDDYEFDAILQHRASAAVEEARAAVRVEPTDAARLLKAVGRHDLLAGLPSALVALLSDGGAPLDDPSVAEAAIATFHSGALRRYRHAIQHLAPPKVWAGRPAALEFVESLGFGSEWAGQPNPKRAPFVDVSGPRSLPDLHDYQKAVVENVRALLRREHPSGENRGLLSMPTGSGKTRVAVQALIEAIRDGEFRGVVLWVADRDELCEQAVEAWQQAWASIGPEAEPLRVSRWWGGQRLPQPPGGHHVIVATIQTLQARIKRDSQSADALRDVSLLAVDEAHGSIAPSYTRLMSELGLTFRRTDDEIALLGLTATPYRGIDKVETERLVNRYGSNRLDKGAFLSDEPEEVIKQLQDMTVLAHADQVVIAGGRVQLTAQEREQAKATPWLPDTVEERLAADSERTREIVNAYKNQVCALGAGTPTLIFATSVEHAETIAAILSLDGITARAVSAKTEPAIRRSIVEQFRAGEIDVLVNYGVFREGFDAPKTRAIIVARPVYSPNLYFQMIGRGLRGELNGGSERCLILNVEDNIENYEGSLAFAELDWLWD